MKITHSLSAARVPLIEGVQSLRSVETVLAKYLAHAETIYNNATVGRPLAGTYKRRVGYDGEVSLGKGNTRLLENIVASELKRSIKKRPMKMCGTDIVSRLVNTIALVIGHHLASTKRCC